MYWMIMPDRAIPYGGSGRCDARRSFPRTKISLTTELLCYLQDHCALRKHLRPLPNPT